MKKYQLNLNTDRNWSNLDDIWIPLVGNDIVDIITEKRYPNILDVTGISISFLLMGYSNLIKRNDIYGDIYFHERKLEKYR